MTPTRTAAWAGATYVLLVLLTRVPLIDSTRPPYVDLTSPWAQLAYWVSESGGATGAPVITVAVLVALVAGRGVGGRGRVGAGVMMVLIVMILAGGGASLNEHVIKPALAIPRPNIIALAGEGGRGPLGRDADAFYALGDKEARSVALRAVLVTEPAPVELSPSVREHWVRETGYSFPSGHALSAMLIAVFFVGAAALVAPGRARSVPVLMGWALLVGLSRSVLRVHTPADVAAGAAMGIALGALGLVALHTVHRTRASGERNGPAPS